MSSKWRLLMLSLLFVLIPDSFPCGQTINPDLLRQTWKANWIRHPDGLRREFGVFLFRKTFALDSVPESFVIHASGDNRYELFVNGTRVVEGPARGDLNHWRFETLDIAPQLRQGKNVLAAQVWNFAERAPMAQMTNETGLIVAGDGPREAAVNTNQSWKCYQNTAWTMIPWDPQKVAGYFAVGPGETVDASRYPWEWEKPDYDDTSWQAASPITKGGPRGIQDSPSRWMLVPRNIPLMEDKAERLARVVRSREATVPPEFLQGRAPLTIAAHTHASLLFDQTYLTTGYPELVTSRGLGSEITLAYAEALYKDHEKGNRSDTKGKEMRGFEDRFFPDGGERRLFRPLWWRTFRYLQLDIQTRDEPLVIEDLHSQFTAYPFQRVAKFETSDPELQEMWEVGWRTARLCAHETYMDCPYYEQLQYGGDTRIQALISLYMTGDDRLVKNAIESLDESRTPEGLTQSRYPSWLPQYIPPFSLFWIGMMHDLWWYRGETDFLRGYLTGTRGVLNWFEARLAPSGLLGRLDWWNFVDWTKDFEGGDPPQEPDGQSSILSLQFAAGLRDAADLESALGSTERAAHYRALAAKIVAAVRKTCWDASRHLFADTPARKHFSQHANLLAVLQDALPAADQPALIKTVLTDPTLTQCSYYFRFYLFRAMKKAGLADQYLEQLGPWRNMLSLGLTTWAETPEPTRSDCHAWSAHPNFDFLATVAGIEPAAPGFREVAIRPHLGSLRQLKATLPHPQGEITVEYQRKERALSADITLPGRLTGTFYWAEKRAALHPGRQHLEF